MRAILSKGTLLTLKCEFSIKKCKVLFKDVLLKNEIVLGLFEQEAFLKEKASYFFEPPLKPKSIKSNNTFSRSLQGNFV